jgi:hypothetical protein
VLGAGHEPHVELQRGVEVPMRAAGVESDLTHRWHVHEVGVASAAVDQRDGDLHVLAVQVGATQALVLAQPTRLPALTATGVVARALSATLITHGMIGTLQIQDAPCARVARRLSAASGRRRASCELVLAQPIQPLVLRRGESNSLSHPSQHPLHLGRPK